MEPQSVLVLMSIAMLAGSFVAGSIPLTVKMSEARLQQFTLLGAGLLVGTALVVIIPEGVHTFYGIGNGHEHAEEGHHDHGGGDGDGGDGESAHNHCSGAHGGGGNVLGVTLAVGFVFMMLIDSLGSGGHSHGAQRGTVVDAEGGASVSVAREAKPTATVGMVVHAAADGIALGASVSSSRGSLEFLVFVAIMMHKAPAAFGLTSFLLHEGYDNTRIRRHLTAFAVAAPIMAIVTFYLLKNAQLRSMFEFETQQATGVALLFSAGTFLYVATVHVLFEIKNMGPADGDASAAAHGHSKELTRSQILLLVCGIIAPIFLSAGHHH